MPVPDLESYKVSAGELSSATKFNNLVQAIEDELGDIDPDQIDDGGASSGQALVWNGSAWAAATVSGATYFPIDLRNPNSNAFPTVAALTDWEAWHWQFTLNVDGKVFGVVKIPPSITISSPQIILEVAANATTGVTRLSVGTKAVADTESLNPGALTQETAQDITVPGTARLRKKVTFSVSETLAADDLVLVEIFHEGAHANDTLAVNTELYGAYLKVA